MATNTNKNTFFDEQNKNSNKNAGTQNRNAMDKNSGTQNRNAAGRNAADKNRNSSRTSNKNRAGE